jgi:ubiquinone/menaquinone biosynthesis C-methylase UbiE
MILLFICRINVIPKSYTATEAPDASYDLVISQDAFLHCADREYLIKEAARILKPGGT